MALGALGLSTVVFGGKVGVKVCWEAGAQPIAFRGHSRGYLNVQRGNWVDQMDTGGSLR